MKWYSVKDLLAGYSLTKDQIRAMCKSGELGAMRFKDSRYHSNHGQYIIPEGELSKLSEYKTGTPTSISRRSILRRAARATKKSGCPS